jgi:hypothetical protein
MQKKLQDLLPYLFPLLAIVFVTVMFARWYQGKTAEAPKALLDTQLEIAALTEAEQSSLIRGTADYKMVAMTGTEGAYGEVRYQVSEDKLVFSVTANLDSAASKYAVWMMSPDGQLSKHMFDLVASKAGLVGSAAITTEVLPARLVVAPASDLELEQIILSADLPAVDAL